MQVRKDLKPEHRTLHECEVTDEDFVNVRETKPLVDEIRRQKVTTEKVAVSRQDIISSEEPQKPKYRKDLDIGRIVIEETPVEKERTPEYDNIQKKQPGPKTTDITAVRRQHEVKERYKKYIKDDIAKLDSTDSSRITEEARGVDEKVQTKKEIADGKIKVIFYSTLYH